MEFTKELASFIVKARFADLPPEVVHETKRVLLDSIGCAIGGLTTERGKIAVKLARNLGGPEEASIIGTNDKVACANAAFAQGELINALDFDAMSTGHISPGIIAAALPQAESMRASGKDLILATALGHEFARRVRSATTGLYPSISEGPHRGMIAWPEVYGYSDWALAGAVAAGKIKNLNQEKMINAIGIAGYFCAPNVMVKWCHTSPVKMSKYGFSGWGAHSGICAAALAEAGYKGDTELFEGRYGYWRFVGYDKWNTDGVLKNLGKEWHAHKITYKQYPCGHCMHAWLDAFIHLINENSLKPDEIEEVNITSHPIAYFPAWSENKLETMEDYGFNVPYLLSCAAYRINPTHWLDAEVRQEPKLKEFRQRVKINVTIDEKPFGLLRLKDPETRRAAVKVVAKGITFEGETKYPKGTWKPEEARNTDAELVNKFVDNVSKIMSSSRANEVAQTILELEKMENVGELMKMVAPQ